MHSSSSTLRDFNGIQEATHSSYDSRTGQRQSLHSRQLPNTVRTTLHLCSRLSSDMNVLAGLPVLIALHAC